MEYVFPKIYKQSKKEEKKARKVYEFLVWFMLGNLCVFMATKIFVWINR